MNRDRTAGHLEDPVQPPLSRDQVLQVPNCGNGLQTLVGPDSGDILDSAGTVDRRIFSGSVSGGREVQAGENHTEPPPTNPVQVPPQQVGASEPPGGSGSQSGFSFKALRKDRSGPDPDR